MADAREMINWSSRPANLKTGASYPLIRCKPDDRRRWVILSREIVGLDTHYWKGRTVPHVKQDCPACADKRPFRWYGFLACLSPGWTKVVHEITPSVCEALEIYAKDHGTIRGSVIEMRRTRGKVNGRIIATLKPIEGVPVEQLPEPHDVIPLLFRLWEVQEHTQLPKIYSKPPGGFPRIVKNGKEEEAA